MKIPKKLASWLTKQRRPAWRPKVRSDDGMAEGSKFAGVPWLAEDEPWPVCESCGKPMQFFFQLDLDRLPVGANQNFGHGLLQLFMCTWIEKGKCEPIRDPHLPFSEATIVRIVEVTGPMKRVEVPEFGEQLPCKAITGWSKEKDWPRPQGMEKLGLRFDEHARYTRDGDTRHCSLECTQIGVKVEDVDEKAFLHSHPCLRGDKLGGWPFWIQEVEYHHCRRCRSMMTSGIFQLQSEDNIPFWFGRAGIGWILQCPKHKDILTFTWQC
jgi:uncharacterized protein YwqG